MRFLFRSGVVFCALAGVAAAPLLGQAAPHGQQASSVPPAGSNAPSQTTPPMSDEDRANQLSDEVGKLMVKCVNLLTSQDPASLDYCKEQRDLADQYPPRQRMVDKMLAHDEYGIALAAFDHQRDALVEFNEEIILLPKAVKPGTIEWSTAYWHRAMVHFQLGEYSLADRDYRSAEESFRKQEKEEGATHPGGKMKTVLRQHAMVMQREGKVEAAQKLLAEASQ
jgi:tetratricopeptide (TPR) repeat protein